MYFRQRRLEKVLEKTFSTIFIKIKYFCPTPTQAAFLDKSCYDYDVTVLSLNYLHSRFYTKKWAN